MLNLIKCCNSSEYLLLVLQEELLKIIWNFTEMNTRKHPKRPLQFSCSRLDFASQHFQTRLTYQYGTL